MPDDLIERFPTTESAPAGPRHARHEVVMRRVGIVLLLAVIVAGWLGLLGPAARTASRTTTAGTITMQYDGLTRPGVDSEVLLTLRPEQRADSYVVSIDQAALATYGIETFAPEPVEQRAQGDVVILEFAAAAGDEFELRLSGRTPTTQPPGPTSWRLRWLVDGSSAATIDVTAWVMP